MPPGSPRTWIATRRKRCGGSPGVVRIDFVRFQDVSLPGGGLPLTVVARPVDEDTVERLLPLRSVASGRAPAGTVPVWASEAALDLRGLDVGREFDLPIGGRTVRASVRGIWRDYERPGGAVVMPRDVFVQLTGDDRATTAALWLAGAADAETVTASIRACWAGTLITTLPYPARSGAVRCGFSTARLR